MEERHWRRLGELRGVTARALEHDLFTLAVHLEDLESGNLLPLERMPAAVRAPITALRREFYALERDTGLALELGEPEPPAEDAIGRIRGAALQLAEALDALPEISTGR